MLHCLLSKRIKQLLCDCDMRYTTMVHYYYYYPYRLGVTTRKAFDSVLRHHLSNQDEENAVHELDELEVRKNLVTHVICE